MWKGYLGRGEHAKTCVSAKRTHRFFDGNFIVSDYEYVCCARNERWKSVGSFSKTTQFESLK